MDMSNAIELLGADQAKHILQTFGIPLTEENVTYVRDALLDFAEVYKANFASDLIGGWSIADVIEAAGDKDMMGGKSYTLSDEEAHAILQQLESNFDASIGINWDVICYAIQGYVDSIGIEADYDDPAADTLANHDAMKGA